MAFFGGPVLGPPVVLFVCDDGQALAYEYVLARIDRSIMTDLLLADQALHEHTAIMSDNTQLQEVKKQLEEAKFEYPRKEYSLYRAESMLGPSIKSLYDTTEADAVADNVDAAHRDIYPKDRKAEVTAL
ncbi:hypothetical protein N7447_010876 [Penicillium robsamsonii]|uniref:uncharacterized protein n=1 Tax=Penicillium robsamsonii TaxID=1792511 RepID=UPI00254690D6|nr:uncharacterized protein N7447_010876 [Penicillium robsamsonii]KAJ5807420.1 hypothetical protein N7447_010876 [Penicillium robsamsonii]